MTRTPNAVDLAHFVQENTAWSAHTRRDYGRVVRRLPQLFDLNRLDDVRVELAEFERRFPRRGFDPAHFLTDDAYRAWRRKLIAATKAFEGHVHPSTYDDAWSALARQVRVLATEHPEFHSSNVLSLAAVAAQARRDDVTPRDLDRAYAERILADADAKRAGSIRAGLALLDRLSADAPALRRYLPAEPFGTFNLRRRGALPAVPEQLLTELELWIDRHCGGILDEITGEMVDGHSQSSRAVYRAAGRAFLGYGMRLGVLDGIDRLEDAFTDDIARLVTREMISCDDPKLRLSERTMRRYLTDVRRLVRSEGRDLLIVARALRTNAVLRSGRRAEQTMSLEARKFCAWLLDSRRNELLYRSLHLRFHTRYLDEVALLEAGGWVPRRRARLKQLGYLAAMTALWTWCAPLRIANMCSLRLYGNRPQIWLPSGSRKEVRLKLAASEMKNARAIDHRLLPGRHKAVETIAWYVEHVRPLHGDGDTSEYLFPAQKSGGHVSANCVRNWLYTHAAAEGIKIKPHWFRHAAATLYIRKFPGAYDHVAQLLDDRPEAVRRYYSWVDDLAVMDDVQRNILEMSGFADE